MVGRLGRILRRLRFVLADRATIANMAPEYGATRGFFGIDEKTIAHVPDRPADADIA